MLNDTILSLKKDAQKIIRSHDMDYEDYLLEVVLRTSSDQTNDVFIEITYSDEKGDIVAVTKGEIYPNAALLQFTTQIAMAAAKKLSVKQLTM